MRTTLLDAKNSEIPEAVGYAACDARFLRLLNSAQQRLGDMGKWWGTYATLRTCVTAGCITWPRSVKTVLGMNVCGYGVPIRNSWYEYQLYRAAPRTGECGCDATELLDRGIVAQHTDFTGLSKVRIYPTTATDAGKRVLLQGKDANGATIRTLDGSVWVDGEYVTIASPFVESVSQFAAPGLTGVQKPYTNGTLTVTAVNVATTVQTQVAIWEPSETAPAYRRTFLNQLPRMCRDYESQSGCTSGCRDTGNGCVAAATACTNIVVDSIVRREYVPAVVDSDWLFISNLAGLKHMMRAIRKHDQNEYQQAEVETQLALRALRNEVEAYSPSTQTQVNVASFGTAKPWRIFRGFS